MLARMGELGIPTQVFAAGAFRNEPGVYAKSCVRRDRAPSPEALDTFLPWLSDVLAAGSFNQVIPSSDSIVLSLSYLRDHLSPNQKRITPTATEALRFLFKDLFHARCLDLGIPVPETWYPGDEDEASSLADLLPYPVLMKPKTHVGIGMAERGILLSSGAELVRRFKPYPGISGAQNFLAKYPALRWPMLQEFLAPPSWRNVSVCGFRGPDGAVRAALAVEKIGQWPPRIGVGTAFRVLNDPDLVSAGISLVESFEAYGIFEIEFQCQGTDRRAIDLNLRAFGMISLPMACGLDLPGMWWQTVEGEQAICGCVRSKDLIWREPMPWHVAMLTSLLKGPDRDALLRSYRNQLRCRTVGAIPSGAGWRMRALSSMNSVLKLRHQLPSYLRSPTGTLMEHWS